MRRLLLFILPLCSAGLHIGPDNYGPCVYFNKVLDCSKRSLDSVPTIDPSLDVNIFYLDDNSISVIESNAFSNISNSLQQLSIKTDTHNITRIDANAFAGLRALRQLSVKARSGNSNNMNRVQINVLLGELESLTTLYIRDLNIGELPISFAGANKLVTLELIRSSITSVDKLAFANASNLETLDLSENQFGTISWLSSTISLKSLTLKSCDVSDIGQLPSLPSLISLNLANNNIKSLGINSFENVAGTLQELNLESNQIPDTAMSGLTKLTALRKLHMTNNQQLTTLPTQFSQLQALELLDVRNTHLEQLKTDDFHVDSSLSSLYLDTTRITTIYTSCFAHLKHLREFTFSSTDRLSEVAMISDDGSVSHGNWSALLTHVGQLQKLSLSGARTQPSGGLNDTIWQVIAPLTELRILTLSYNSIQSVPDFFLYNFANLSSIDLSNNVISKVTSATFYNFNSTTVQLANNNISRIDNCTLSMYTCANSVELTGNPLICDCSLQWLHKRLQEAGSLTGMTCSGPGNLTGKQWTSIDSASFCQSGETPPADCQILTPTTMAPTTTPFLYPLNIEISKVDESTVKLGANTNVYSSQFRAYTVTYGQVGTRLTNTSEQLIAQATLLLSVESNKQYMYCYILLPIGGGEAVESERNCKTFVLLPASTLGVAAIAGIVVGGAVLLLLLLLLLVCCVCKGRREQKGQLKNKEEDPYTYTYPDDKQVGNGKYQPTLRPGSKRFSKRSVNNLAASRPSLATSTTTIATTRSSGFGVQNGLRQARSQEFVLNQAPPLPERHRATSQSRSIAESLNTGDTMAPYVEMRDPSTEEARAHQMLQQQQQQQQYQYNQQQQLLQPPVAFDNSAFQRGGSCYEMGNF